MLKTLKIKYINKGMTTAISVVVVLFLLISCASNETEQIDPVLNRADIPRLHALQVTTVTLMPIFIVNMLSSLKMSSYGS